MDNSELTHSTLDLTGTRLGEWAGMTVQEIENALVDYCVETSSQLDGIHDRAEAIYQSAEAIYQSAAASALGSIRTAKKAASSRENGKRGGRPCKTYASLQELTGYEM